MDLLDDASSSDEEEAPLTSSKTTTAGQATKLSKPGFHPELNPSTQRTFPHASNSATGSQKARKFLSLAAVLPQHIFEELTKSQVVGGEDGFSDDEGPTVAGSKKAPASKDGIANFLSDLKSAKQSDAATVSLEAKRSTSVHKKKSLQPLGAAFLQTTTVVHKKNEGSVRDIHGEIAGETVDEEEEDEKDVAVETMEKPATSLRTSIMRPKVNSAPPIQTDPSHANAAFATQVGTFDDTTANADDNNHNTRKRTRREMENALRRGDFQQALANKEDQVTTLQQARPDSFVPDPETYALPKHGIRVVPTTMYDPKAGAATNQATGKGRGKNQIHHLMANAASLEVQRARGMANTSDATKHRANAKQKYGW